MFPLRSNLKKYAWYGKQGYRKVVQYLFLLTTLWIGLKFAFFIGQLERGILPTLSRPPGVEAFLPISSLISLKYWLVSGVFNRVHPSGLVLLLIILSTAFMLKRGFCSWICPFGLLTEHLNRLHHFIFKKDVKVPHWIDYPLRSLKYLLLLYFLRAVMLKMNALTLEYFINSPYNRIADIKMFYFFEDISRFALLTLVSLCILSVLIRNFWCRYLCPYGALLGGLSLLSLFKIHRNQPTCTVCGKCTRTCPADIQVHRVSRVISDECHACLKCVDACPEKDTLNFSLFQKWGILKPWLYATAVTSLFVGGTFVARITGYWQNNISNHEYLFHVSHLDLPFYSHNRGQITDYHKDVRTKKRDKTPFP